MPTSNISESYSHVHSCSYNTSHQTKYDATPYHSSCIIRTYCVTYVDSLASYHSDCKQSTQSCNDNKIRSSHDWLVRLTHGVLSPSVGKELDNCKCCKKLRNENLVVSFFDVRLFNKYLSLLTWCKKVNLCKIKISIQWFSSCLHRLSQYQLSNSIYVSNWLQRCRRVWDHMRSIYIYNYKNKYIISLLSNDFIFKENNISKNYRSDFYVHHNHKMENTSVVISCSGYEHFWPQQPAWHMKNLPAFLATLGPKNPSLELTWNGWAHESFEHQRLSLKGCSVNFYFQLNGSTVSSAFI